MADTFQALPEHIKDWASSDSTTFLIAEINNRLGLKEGRRRIIPSLILRLITLNLEPQDFINELANELRIGFQAAKSIAEDIENHILRSIENELRRDAGVDVKLIRFGQLRSSKPSLKTLSPAAGPIPQPKPSEMPAPKPMPTAPTIQKSLPIVDLQSFQIKKGTAKPNLAEPEALPTVPFMLHQADQITQTAATAGQAAALPRLNIKIPAFSRPMAEKSALAGQAAPKPISVKIEIPQSTTTAGQAASAGSGQAARVVHYSDFRTPISRDGALKSPVPTTENILDLRKIFGQETNSNTVDLRKQDKS